MNIALKDEVSELTEIFSELEPQARKTVIDLMKLLRPDKQNQSKPKGKRVFGMHDGQGFISDDFNDELGDEFWFGEDFGIIKKDDESAD